MTLQHNPNGAVQVRLEGAEAFQNALSELSATIEPLVCAGDLPPQVIERLLDLLDTGGELARLVPLTAVGARTFAFRLEVADPVLCLLAAARTGDLDLSVFEHFTIPCVG